ncbi:hypothetical protein DOS83_11925 [Staphylococcus felis]|uniref:Uncharacterized protein n=1 Tax=Staphylococcus felis TaxID=46127 RepID=A0A3E0ILP5_9STAP|nr:hypothetical protein DOS61_00725 [Staphylococcus felis]REH90963.1 hypothetical protein DOS83_11925 [Staphylococcus felis]REH91556.1 hypothetical protein DOS58_02860 [Staphylococcus felis]REI04217.1 hypothetical protein DOS69_11960 [Staphylococcus felis]REI10638.1 hypothetical protein DOS71_05120 [Staphylococcus felis]
MHVLRAQLSEDIYKKPIITWIIGSVVVNVIIWYILLYKGVKNLKKWIFTFILITFISLYFIIVQND